MTLPDLYQAVGGNYQNVLERLGDEQTVRIFVLRFPCDSSYGELVQCLQEKDMARAFHAAHTLKGVTLSLGFGRLSDCAVAVCEKLRKGAVPSKKLLQQLQTEYTFALATINDYVNDL